MASATNEHGCARLPPAEHDRRPSEQAQVSDGADRLLPSKRRAIALAIVVAYVRTRGRKAFGLERRENPITHAAVHAVTTALGPGIAVVEVRLSRRRDDVAIDLWNVGARCGDPSRVLARSVSADRYEHTIAAAKAGVDVLGRLLRIDGGDEPRHVGARHLLNGGAGGRVNSPPVEPALEERHRAKVDHRCDQAPQHAPRQSPQAFLTPKLCRALGIPRPR